ncbi:hypothetical protein AX17_003807 [Amanita inopinata Kibby_2008]|nr:hypothetical protein AX17_003807 [Amanita inopinata Kibby_2008]
MQLPLLQFFLVLFAARTTWALHESDVGVIDWHKRLIGVPLSEAVETAPIFHHVGDESVVVMATSSNVLAALHPVNGSVAWRFIFEGEDKINSFVRNGEVISTLSGPGGATLRSFEATTGHLIREQSIHPSRRGRGSEPSYFGNALAFAVRDDEASNGPADIYVLTNGHTVSYIDGSTGEVKWKWRAPDESSSVIYTKLKATSYALYVIGVTKSFSTYTLHITALSSTTGEMLNETEVNSSILQPTLEMVLLSLQVPHSYRPRISWLEKGKFKSKALTPDLKNPIKVKVTSTTNSTYEKILDVGVSDLGYVVATKLDGPATVMMLEQDGAAVMPVWLFEEVDADEALELMYAGGRDKDGNAYVTRVFWSKKVGKAAVELFSSHTTQQQRFYFPFDTISHGVITHVTLAVSDSPQLVVSTSTGSVQSWLLPPKSGEEQPDAELIWIREEGLTEISVAELVELPEKTASVSAESDSNPAASVVKEGDGFVGRLRRQLVEARNLPQYLYGFFIRFTTGSYPSSTSPVNPASSNTTELVRDTFGFRQLIIAATQRGKVYGIDTANGDIVWSRAFGVGWASGLGPDGKVVGATLSVAKIYEVEGVVSGKKRAKKSKKGKKGKKRKGKGKKESAEEAGRPGVVLVSQRAAGNTLVDTVIFHVDPLTGADIREDTREVEGKRGLLEGTDIILGPMVDAYLLDNTTKAVVLLDEFLQVYVYPENDRTKDMFDRVAPSLSLPLQAGIPEKEGETPRKKILGHGVSLNANLSDRYVAQPTWTLSLPPDEELQAFVPAVRTPVASHGKVLGNRTTLYKYLSGRMFGVLTEPYEDPELAKKKKKKKKSKDTDSSGSTNSTTSTASTALPVTCGVYVVDAVKGTIIYHAAVPASTGPNGMKKVCNVKMNLVENWLVYHYYDEDVGLSGTASMSQSKGWRMVSVELYEGQVDEKTGSADMSSFSEGMKNVTVFEQSYVFPHGVDAIATTSTKFGISSKDIIVATKNNKIQTISRRLLDPRRPKKKPTNEELMEGLIEYDPVIPDDPKRVISHEYETAHIRRIVTSPALLESTSLVFAYGLDLFLTRVSPSGTFDVLSESFNKAQLVFTIAGLVVAIVITRPMVKRRMLRQRWYG